jgi:chromosomal replication initiator protein
VNEQLWQSVLGEIELSVSKGSFMTWFKNTVLLKAEDGQVVVGVPNVFGKQQLEVKYADFLKEALENNGVKVKTLEFKIHSVIKTAEQKKAEAEAQTQSQNRSQAAAQNANNRPLSVSKQGLNSKYTFDTFIEGSGNELAHTACLAIVDNPGNRYNPLFVYGGVGLGKTHLIQAVGNEIIKRNPKTQVAYITTEQFVNEFLDHIRYKKKGFSERYRTADVLIVDDMQFIAGKEKTQEEFFHTFNALHQANKQIIISSDKPPKSIPTLEERLRSRFEWGMTIDIQPPDFETRCAILQAKAGQHGVTLDQDVIEYLATHVQSNVRELEGSLNQLLAHSEMRNVEPSMDVATSLMSSARMRPKHITPKQVIERTAKHFQIDIDEITGPKRDKDIVVPRQIAMYLLRSELHLSFPKVARELGRKDHTTAIHSVEKIEKGLSFDQLMRQHVNEIKERLYA